MAENETNKVRQVMLTTFDNPYDPFEDFTLWYKFDEKVLKHCCCGLIARFASGRNDLSDEEERAEQEAIIDRILEFDDANIYKKVVKYV